MSLYVKIKKLRHIKKKLLWGVSVVRKIVNF